MLSHIPTSQESDAMTDAEWLGQVATGLVISREEVATALDAGHRVYTIDRTNLNMGIARVLHSAAERPNATGFWIGAKSII